MDNNGNVNIFFTSEFPELINNFILSVDLFNTYEDDDDDDDDDEDDEDDEDDDDDDILLRVVDLGMRNCKLSRMMC